MKPEPPPPIPHTTTARDMFKRIPRSKVPSLTFRNLRASTTRARRAPSRPLDHHHRPSRLGVRAPKPAQPPPRRRHSHPRPPASFTKAGALLKPGTAQARLGVALATASPGRQARCFCPVMKKFHRESAGLNPRHRGASVGVRETLWGWRGTARIESGQTPSKNT
jgi:hypothetical protein